MLFDICLSLSIIVELYIGGSYCYTFRLHKYTAANTITNINAITPNKAIIILTVVLSIPHNY